MRKLSLSNQQIADLIMSFIGEIEPVGETNTDNKRSNNLKLLLSVMDCLLDEIYWLLPYTENVEHSMHMIGDEAERWMKEKHEWLKDVFELDEELLKRVLDDVDVVGYEREKYEWGLGLIESYISDMKELPSAQPDITDINVGSFESKIHAMFDHIWDCEIDHPVFQDTVGELMDAVIRCYNRLPSAQPEKMQLLEEDATKDTTSDCISRQTVRMSKKLYDEDLSDYERGWNDACDAIADAAPSVHPERKMGKWIPHKERSREYIGTVLINVEYDYWFCDICGYRVKNGQPMYNFCPNCGADMRGENK